MLTNANVPRLIALKRTSLRSWWVPGMLYSASLSNWFRRAP